MTLVSFLRTQGASSAQISLCYVKTVNRRKRKLFVISRERERRYSVINTLPDQAPPAVFEGGRFPKRAVLASNAISHHFRQSNRTAFVLDAIDH